MEDASFRRIETPEEQTGQGLHVAAGALDGNEAGLGGGARRGVADGEERQHAARITGGEGANPVGAGHRDGLHAVEVDGGTGIVFDGQQRLDQRLVAAPGEQRRQRFAVLAGTG